MAAVHPDRAWRRRDAARRHVTRPAGAGWLSRSRGWTPFCSLRPRDHLLGSTTSAVSTRCREGPSPATATGRRSPNSPDVRLRVRPGSRAGRPRVTLFALGALSRSGAPRFVPVPVMQGRSRFSGSGSIVRLPDRLQPPFLNRPGACLPAPATRPRCAAGAPAPDALLAVEALRGGGAARAGAYVADPHLPRSPPRGGLGPAAGRRHAGYDGLRSRSATSERHLLPGRQPPGRLAQPCARARQLRRPPPGAHEDHRSRRPGRLRTLAHAGRADLRSAPDPDRAAVEGAAAADDAGAEVRGARARRHARGGRGSFHAGDRPLGP